MTSSSERKGLLATRLSLSAYLLSMVSFAAGFVVGEQQEVQKSSLTLWLVILMGFGVLAGTVLNFAATYFDRRPGTFPR